MIEWHPRRQTTRWNHCRLCDERLLVPKPVPRHRAPFDVEAWCPVCNYHVEYVRISLPRVFTEYWTDHHGDAGTIHYFEDAIYLTCLGTCVFYPRLDVEAPEPVLLDQREVTRVIASWRRRMRRKARRDH